jgi:hypothetical protein
MHHHWGASGYCGELLAVSLRGPIRCGMPMSRLCHLLAERSATCGSAESEQVLLARRRYASIRVSLWYSAILLLSRLLVRAIALRYKSRGTIDPTTRPSRTETSLETELRCRRDTEIDTKKRVLSSDYTFLCAGDRHSASAEMQNTFTKDEIITENPLESISMTRVVFRTQLCISTAANSRGLRLNPSSLRTRTFFSAREA